MGDNLINYFIFQQILYYLKQSFMLIHHLLITNV